MSDMHPDQPMLTKAKARELYIATYAPWIAMALTAAIGLTYCTANKISANRAKIEACVAKGVAWYKEAGSYPYLKSKGLAGTPTEEHVRQSCRRNPNQRW